MRALHACLALLVTIARSRRAVAWALPPPAACYVRVWWSGTFYHSTSVVSVVVTRLTGHAVVRASQIRRTATFSPSPIPGLVVLFHIPVHSNGLDEAVVVATAALLHAINDPATAAFASACRLHHHHHSPQTRFLRFLG